MHPPSKISVQCCLLQEPLPGILVKVTLRMSSKNDYHCYFGPSDSKGHIDIYWSSIIREANETLQMALMDYIPLTGGFTGTIVIRPLTATEIDAALNAYELYKDVDTYPLNWKTRLLAAKDRLAVLRNAINISLVLEHDGSGIVIESV